jgi:uncharacterized protein
MRPLFRLLAERQDVTDKIADRLISLTLTDSSGEDSDTLRLTLDNRDRAIALPRKGASLELSLGFDGGGLARLGLWEVDDFEVSGPPETLAITAKALAMSTPIKGARQRSWHDTTLGNIALAIAQRSKLQLSIAADVAALAIDHVDQTESDIHLLTRLGQSYDLVVKLGMGRLVIQRKAVKKSVSGEDLQYVEITPAMVSSYRFSWPDRGQYQSVKANWQALNAAQRHTETAGEGEPSSELGVTFATQADAKAAAAAALARFKRGTGKVSLSLARANLAIGAEQPLKTTGWGGGLDGAWTTVKVEHVLDSAGLITRIEAQTEE